MAADKLNMVLESFNYRTAPITDKQAPPPPPGERPPVDPKDPDLKKKGDEGFVPKHKLGDTLKSALNGPGRFIHIQDAKSLYNIPKGAKIHVIEPGDTPEHIASIMKKGEYLFDPDSEEMMVLGWSNGMPTISNPLTKRK